jgi:ribose 5-phosphate isomerase B
MIYLGADHRGFEIKDKIKSWLTENEFDYEDTGAFKLDSGDSFVVYAEAVSEKIINPEDRGIIICGSGVGVDVVANRHENIRAGLVINAEQIALARKDDDINVLIIAADFVGGNNLSSILESFFRTPFSGEAKYSQRLEEIKNIHG